MSNRDVDGAIEWLANQSKNPTQSWKGLCQSSCRQAYGLPAWASSATQAWAAVDKKYKVECPDYKDKSWWSAIPRGAIIYSTAGKYGHAWIADNDMTGWSVDYKRSGYIDRVEIRLKGGPPTTKPQRGTSPDVSGTRATASSKAYRPATGITRFQTSKMSCSRTTIGLSPRPQLGDWPAACPTLATGNGRTARSNIPRFTP